MAQPEDTSGMTEKQEGEYDAAGSYQREIQQDVAAENMGTMTPPAPKRDGSLGEKETPDTAGTNPKRTENSREG